MSTKEIHGIWKGEYIYDDRYQPALVKTPVPFILKINSIDEKGLWEGTCMEDPAVSRITIPAAVYGRTKEEKELLFCKKYPKTFMNDALGKLVVIDEPHPDVLYEGKLSDNGQFFGTWHVARTFRKLNGTVLEIRYISGVWWMKRL